MSVALSAVSSYLDRRNQDTLAEQGVEFEIITGPPIPLAARTMIGNCGGGWYWVEHTGLINFATSYEQACRDHREYVLEILSA